MLQAIAARFPSAVQDGVLNRKALGPIVFQKQAELADLNAITHPFICEAVASRLSDSERNGCKLAAIDAVALTESGLARFCDETIAVTAPLEARVVRLMAREEIPEEYARLRIAAQKKNEQFIQQCSRTICNDCPTEAEFCCRCDALLLKIIGGTENESKS